MREGDLSSWNESQSQRAIHSSSGFTAGSNIKQRRAGLLGWRREGGRVRRRRRGERKSAFECLAGKLASNK